MPNVFVVPVYVEVPSGFERAIATLESYLRRAGYAFYTGEPLLETLEETKEARFKKTSWTRATMAKSEREYLLELWDQNICPNCGKNIAEGTRVGSGRKSEGGFCSLDCYATYYQTELIERAKKIAELAARHQNS